MPSARGLEAVTVDAAGTSVELVDPIDGLRHRLAARGVMRERSDVRDAFAAEVAYYVPRSLEGRDDETLARLRRNAVAVFLRELNADLEPESFVPDFLGAIVFRPIPGAAEALLALRAAGLRLACVANWDRGLAGHLERAGLAGLFETTVGSWETGAAKPDPAPFRLALGRLGIEPGRALHIGDGDVDREGARRAGLAFAPVPLATLPARLGLSRGRNQVSPTGSLLPPPARGRSSRRWR